VGDFEVNEIILKFEIEKNVFGKFAKTDFQIKNRYPGQKIGKGAGAFDKFSKKQGEAAGEKK
jgi:hypothetical protein